MRGIAGALALIVGAAIGCAAGPERGSAPTPAPGTGAADAVVRMAVGGVT